MCVYIYIYIYCEGNEVYLHLLNFICDAKHSDNMEIVCWNGNLVYAPNAWWRDAPSFHIINGSQY